MELPSLEHIFVYGEIGSGKTKASLSIADILREHTFHYIQADRPVGKIFNAFHDLSNVVVWDGFSHSEIQKSVDRISLLLKASKQPEKTWVIIDTIGRVYTDVQDTYSFGRYKMSADDHRATLQGQGTLKSTIDGFTQGDWSIIKRMFLNDIMYPMCKFYGNNYFLIAHQRPIVERVQNGQAIGPTVTRELKTIYDDIGYVPHTHHEVARWVDTHLWFNNNSDPFTMKTVKDTERKYMHTPAPFEHFWLDYNRLTALNGYD